MEEQKWVYDERITDDIRNLLIRVRDEGAHALIYRL